ncbi:hypothetical protein QBC32DRAFT_69541 [Pseudoneurospora amorphoporcata]|uniref:Uncharacterized protein n=1 Tax=Pseudoneurospora amorphoporcata TaxID=241081 RepID=A0AAN6NMV3_9PEZI|nr:hypothetical protein QBC32DRAFT_69541 [Pseudoneurospora amorphoporcata]
MLTSAVFLRAASFGIPTAQPLKTGLGRSFTAIALCGSLFQSNATLSAAFAHRGRQDGSHTPTISPSPKISARLFHASAVCRPNCDWGRPCNCSECREAAREPICEICKVNSTAYQSESLGRDRKGVLGYHFTSFCGECWAKREQKIRED